jgi:hypothetical protein
MPRQSIAEIEFTAKYPNARVVPAPDLMGYRFAIYCGDYLCAGGRTRGRAFAEALRYDRDGIITPDPNEVSTTAGVPGEVKL